jgi:RNA recognition motif-containing protein
MAKKLFFGNLAWGVSDADLQDIVSRSGRVVSVRVISDRDTGRSRGFGFVEVEDQDAETVIASLNGQDLQGRPLIVNEAKPREDRGDGFRGSQRRSERY